MAYKFFNDTESGGKKRQHAKEVIHEAMTGPRVVGKLVKEAYKHATNRHDGHEDAHHEKMRKNDY